jgi:hypothetical protein
MFVRHRNDRVFSVSLQSSLRDWFMFRSLPSTKVRGY